MITEAQREHLRAIGRKGGATRARQFTRDHQRAARRKVKSESLSRSGAKGARVTIERHGLGTLFEQSRRYRLSHPRPLELRVIGILSTLKVKYEREFVVCEKRYFTVDFWLPEYELAIEVHGAIHDPGKPNYKRRLQNDSAKRALLTEQNRRVLVLHHSEFVDLTVVIARIRKEIGV